jgi:hypothetical protein
MMKWDKVLPLLQLAGVSIQASKSGLSSLLGYE